MPQRQLLLTFVSLQHTLMCRTGLSSNTIMLLLTIAGTLPVTSISCEVTSKMKLLVPVCRDMRSKLRPHFPKVAIFCKTSQSFLTVMDKRYLLGLRVNSILRSESNYLDLNNLNVDASPFPLQLCKLALQFAFQREMLALLDCLAALAPFLFIF